MATKSDAQKQRELAMFGCDINVFIESVDESESFKLDGVGRIIQSILSEVQEMLTLGQTNEARQNINRAKHLISHYQLGLVPRPERTQPAAATPAAGTADGTSAPADPVSTTRSARP